MAKQLGGAGYKAIVMAIQVSARGFIESSVKDPQGKLPIFGNKYLMLLADYAENSFRWIQSTVC